VTSKSPVLPASPKQIDLSSGLLLDRARFVLVFRTCPYSLRIRSILPPTLVSSRYCCAVLLIQGLGSVSGSGCWILVMVVVVVVIVVVVC
jgi:hypothetical protein